LFFRVKKMTMKDVSAQASVPLSAAQTCEFETLIQEFVDLVADPFYYRLMTLMALTRATQAGGKNELASLKSHYELILRRRTEWIFRSDPGTRKDNIFRKFNDPEILISKVFSCFEKLDKLEKILLFIMNKKWYSSSENMISFYVTMYFMNSLNPSRKDKVVWIK